MNEKDQISHLPGQILFDIARNDSGIPDYRMAAVEILVEKNYPQASQPDIAVLVKVVKDRLAIKEELIDAVEGAIEQPIPTLCASITTASLNGENEELPLVTEEVEPLTKDVRETD
jgi:hypothetical protein